VLTSTPHVLPGATSAGQERPSTQRAANPAHRGAVSYCVAEGIDALDPQPWGRGSPLCASGRHEEMAQVERAAAHDQTWRLAEVDIFCDLSPAEMDAIAAAAPMRTYAAGDLLYSTHEPTETLFILKRGRVRIFRISGDGRALTTAIITPGTIFGQMVLLGQSMHDDYAEALDEAVVCVMSRADVHTVLLSDARIAARITEILGRRLHEMEQRLSDTVFKTVPQRIAGTLIQLAAQQRRYGLPGRDLVVAFTHEQVAAVVGTSRETATKTLGEFAEQGLIQLRRGRITLLDPDRLREQAGD
jgi:CRP-like cAMP-binding protein